MGGDLRVTNPEARTSFSLSEKYWNWIRNLEANFSPPLHVPGRHGVFVCMKIYTFAVLLLAAQASAFAADAPLIQPSLLPTDNLAALGLVDARVVAASNSCDVLVLETPTADTRTAYALSSGKLVKLDLTIPKKSLVAVSGEYIAWIPTNAKGPRALTVYSVAKASTTEMADPPYASQLKLVGESVFVLHHRNRNMELSRLRLGEASFELLWVGDSGQEVVNFGNSTGGEIVLVDPIQAQFRIDSISPAYQQGVWHKIQTDIMESIASQPPNVKFGPGVRGYSSTVLAHQSTGSGHIFIMADGIPFKGQYAIAVDNEGKELRRFVLGYRSDSRESFQPHFANVVSGKDSLTLWSVNGQQLVFPGVH